jgi:tetratricopeptide (TPR) repeat protein
MVRGSSALVIAFVLAGAFSARADNVTDDAVRFYQRATTAFALGRFAEAAADYERAFELKPDAALLFDAAQAHLRAGNRARALELYRNYLGLYRERTEHRAYVEKQMTSLKAELAAEAEAKRRAVATDAATKKQVVSAPVVVGAPPLEHRRRWVWPVVAASVVVGALAIGLGVGLGVARNPTTTLGSFTIGLVSP